MKAAVLYSGGKDSSFVAVMLERLGLDVELYTANFGVYDSYVPAQKSA
jgi:predicted subunit of tRNA(5-methylaminomethyl-2-thiouridylate) methyltransferase